MATTNITQKLRRGRVDPPDDTCPVEDIARDRNVL
jgi:hypothetical protein